jgi:signal transduction histidine kinase
MIKNKLSSVVFLLVTVIVFINVLQFLWVYHSYKTTKDQYKDLLNRALHVAALDYTQWKVRVYEDYLEKNTEVIVSPPPKEAASGSAKITRKPSAAKTFSFTTTIKTLPDQYKRLYKAEHRDPYAFEARLFDSLFKRQLVKNDIRASFIIDTFQLKDDLGTVANHAVLHNKYPVQTESIRLNVFSKLGIRASVKNYPQYILKNILFILVLSLLAIIAANLFLFYTLKKTSKEKKSREIRDDFLSNITHEIKTPIAIINSAIDTLLYHTGLDNKEKAMKYLHTSKKEIQHLNNMVDTLMDAAIDKELPIGQLGSIDIIQLVNTILDKYTLLYGSEISINYTPLENKKKVAIDQLHFPNALNNIIENAIKYSDKPARIEITSSVTEEVCEISIKDNGVGIPARYQDVIFEKFFRVPDSSYRQGYGLGLYYTKKVVESHKGIIAVQSRTGAGTEFIIKIPVAHDKNITTGR